MLPEGRPPFRGCIIHRHQEARHLLHRLLLALLKSRNLLLQVLDKSLQPREFRLITFV